MKTIKLHLKSWGQDFPERILQAFESLKKEHLLFGVLILLLAALPMLVNDPEETATYLLKQMLPLILIAFTVFAIILALAFWLVQRFWEAMGLPELSLMVLQFNELKIWLQLGFYLVCFALVLATGVGVLIAVL